MRGFFGVTGEGKIADPVNPELAKKYFILMENPKDADAALVFIESPHSGPGYDVNDLKKGGNGYLPISLQYNDYTAVDARDASIAGGDPYENFTNRSYKGKTVKTDNKSDLELILQTRKQMKDKPVIVIISMKNPTVMSEFEKDADAIVVGFDVQRQALLDIISGAFEPSVLLPLQMPTDMKTVEEQNEDAPHDMRCYTDSEGHVYDFAFGMNWKGVINDARTDHYKINK